MARNRLGPLLIDSLDVPNAVTKKNGIAKIKQKDNTPVLITFVSSGMFILMLFFAFCIYRLTREADHSNNAARIVLWAMYLTTAITLVGMSIGTVTTCIIWLKGWAIKNNLVSLVDGPHIRASDVRSQNYEEMFALFAEKMYTVAQEAAKQSQYHGVQTLSLDQSSSQSGQTAVTAGNQKEQAHAHESLYFDVSLLDKVNKQ